MEDHSYFTLKPPKRQSASAELKREAAKRTRDRRRQKSRINIGMAFPRWRALKQEHCFQSDADFASFLLDSVYGEHVLAQGNIRRLQKSTHVPAPHIKGPESDSSHPSEDHHFSDEDTEVTEICYEVPHPCETDKVMQTEMKSDELLDLDVCKDSVTATLHNGTIPQCSKSHTTTEVKEEPVDIKLQPESRLEVSTRPAAPSEKIHHSFVQTPNPVMVENGIAVNQLQLSFQPKLCCEVSCQTEVSTRDAACQTCADPPIKHSLSTRCTLKSEQRNESTPIKPHEKRVSCGSLPLAASSPLKRPRKEDIDDVTSHPEKCNLSICFERVCRENLSAQSNRKLQKSTHKHASTEKKKKLKSEDQQLMSKDQIKSEDQLDQDICKVSVALALENADIVSQSPTSTIKEKRKEKAVETKPPESRLKVSTSPAATSDKMDHNYVRTPNPVMLENRLMHRERMLASKKSSVTGLFQTCLQCGGPVLEYTTISSGNQNRLQWKCSKGHLMWLFPNTNPT